MSWKNRHYHFIGIGGIGMGAIASLLLDKGCRVSGSDQTLNAITDHLERKGARIYRGQKKTQVGDADRVVYSSAITRDNVEFAAAEAKQIPIQRRADLLAELMEDYIGITVAGAHGKTTTTSMLSCLLTAGGFQPTTAVGGMLKGLDTNAYTGEGKYFLAEVDESDGSFLQFRPTYSVITNMDEEHLDFYGSFQEIEKAYASFIQRTAQDGVLFVCSEDRRLIELSQAAPCRVRTFGFSQKDHIRAANIRFQSSESTFDCLIDQQLSGTVTLPVPGMHNVANVLAAIGLADHFKMPFTDIICGLKAFRGVERRFECIGTIDGISFIDDYAHHPTEIRCTLQTARAVKKERVVTIFQPHRYSRFEYLWEDFKEALLETDYLIVTDVYAAGEQPREGMASSLFAEQLQKRVSFPVVYFPQDKITEHLNQQLRDQDLVLSLGAGDLRYTMMDYLSLKKHLTSEVSCDGS